MHGFFGDLWFAFPVPFQEGDIVYAPNGNEREFCQGPFVLTETATDVYCRTGMQMDFELDISKIF